MADTATADRPNKVTVSDAGPARKKLSIEIPAETVDAHLKQQMDTLANTITLPGFRPGRVPRKLVEKRFGSSVREEAKSRLIGEAYQKAIKEHNLQIVGDPAAESLADLKLADGQALSFELEVEVVPEFELPNLDGIPVKKPTLEVTDQMVDDEIKKICINEGELENREAPEAGDYVTGHGVMTGKDGAEFYNLNGAVIQVPTADKNGKGMVLGVMVDDFSKQLGLPKPGETATIKTKGPENHEVEKIRGADLTITFKVDRVDRIIPAKLADIVARYGWPDEAKLREFIKSRLTQNVIVRQQVVMRQQVAKHLVESTKIDLPPRMAASQAARLLERQRLELMYRGVDPQKIEEHLAELRAASGAKANSELKMFFILHKAANKFDVKVTQGDVDQRIHQLAAENNTRPEQLKQDLMKSGRINGIAMQIQEHKAMDAIVSRAKVEEVPAEEFDKLMKQSA
ncbi:MAG: trigger factor [Phycisphaerales bacterium]|nr:trigger factor [Phycisphaerales bacterium]